MAAQDRLQVEDAGSILAGSSRDAAGAEEALRRAVALDPTYVGIGTAYAEFLA